MANETRAGIKTSAPYDSVNFPALAEEISEQAYIMMYESTILSKLVRPIGQGEKGTAIHWPYFDPSTIAGAVATRVAATETQDISVRYALTGASRWIVSSEFGVQGFITDTLLESGTFDFKGELSRQLGIGMAVRLEKYLNNVLTVATASGGFNTFLATNTTNGLSYTKIAAAKSLLDAQLVQIEGTKNLVVTDYAYFMTAKGTYSTTYQQAIAPFGDEVMRRWYITSMFGDINVFRNNHLTTTATRATCLMFVKDSAGLWQPRDLRVEPERDASARATELNATMRVGAKVLIPAWGLRITAYAPTPS